MKRRSVGRPAPVYVLADAGALAPTPVPVAVERLAQAGVGWIQVRAKKLEDRLFYDWLEESCRRLEGSDAALWVDDRPDLARLFPVAGVHLGQRDLPPGAARGVIGKGRWIGASAHDRSQLRAADADPEVDVIAVGPVFATESKDSPDPVVGLELVRWARGATSKPLIAIGGIHKENVAAVLAAGADSAAVLGAVCRGEAACLEDRARRLVTAAAGAEA